MKQTNKVIIAGSCIFPGGAGGAVRCMHMLAKGFAANGHQVEVVTTYGSEKSEYKLDIDHFQLRTFGYMSSGQCDIPYYIKIKIHLMLLAYLINQTIKGSYNLLIFYGPVLSFMLVSMVALIMKRPMAYIMADIQPETAKMKLSEKLKRSILNLVDISLANAVDLVVILGTSKLVRRYTRFAPKSSRLQILAPVDTDIFAGGNGSRFKEKFEIRGKRIVTYSGTLDTLEGIDVLLNSMRFIRETRPDVVLVIAGQALDIDHVLRKKMDFKALASELGVASYTVFTGHLQMHEVIDLLNASDVLVMPKIDHPMNHVASPIKIAEYLAAGRAIVSSRICELDRHLKHMEHVIFCDPGNAKELADAIRLILDDEVLKRKLSSNTASIARSLYDYRGIAQKIYSKICS